MGVITVEINQFLVMSESHPIFDVRSPSEYNQAHIVGAANLPLFSDSERAVVGTSYKQQGKQDAIKIGLDYFGPRMRSMVENVERTLANHDTKLAVNMEVDNIVLVHCWRGGMRSSAVAWLLDLYGFNVYLLKGGYKAYRNWVLDNFRGDYNFQVIGGFTGSGKTKILYELANRGEEIIDLENLAKHKGSTFGHIGLPEQPTQEMFENLLAHELASAKQRNKAIWIEDESQRIGHVNIPANLWKTIANARLYFLEIPFEERLNYLVIEYGELDAENMVNAILRIQKRLGGLETKNAINYLQEGNRKESFRILLTYYDKWYQKGLSRRDKLGELPIVLVSDVIDFKKNCGLLLNQCPTNLSIAISN